MLSLIAAGGTGLDIGRILLELGIIDEIVNEPVGGAHTDPAAAEFVFARPDLQIVQFPV